LRAPTSLRVRLLRVLLAPLAAILAVSSIAAYYFSVEPAMDAFDHGLINNGVAVADRIRMEGGQAFVDLPSVAQQVLRTDRFDRVYYLVRDAKGRRVDGEEDLPPPPEGEKPDDGVIVYDAQYRGEKIRAAALLVPCGGEICTVIVAETTVKRQRLVREILLWNVLPELLLAGAALALMWRGVERALEPLAQLSNEIRARSPRDLRSIDEGQAPEEAQQLVGALNRLFARVGEANLNQQRFLSNAAHQLRTPLAGLQAHTELALAQPVPAACRAELEQVHTATIRTARLANQLLALARAEPGAERHAESAAVDLKQVVEDCANEWVHRALGREIDLGFDLAPAIVRGDGFLLHEALVNLIGNAVEYTPAGGSITVRTGVLEDGPFMTVEDSGPGIAPAERERVLERFYRTAGTPGTGSGLGLAIVHEIAAAHRSTVAIGEGAPNAQGGRGCRVSLNFPAADPMKKA
jgi:two-component system, OmpR family, sensor histidine kinase TctE